jgi:tRNA(Ile)-lysidine synthase
VDHALRAGSDAEAEGVAGFCHARGIAHRIMTWTGPRPAAGVPAAARAARYRLLAQAAGEAGIGLIATGHTADDQAETIWMRQARTTGIDSLGLAGMAPATLYGGDAWIARPLLGTRRGTLRGFLRTQDVGWIDDPTNADSRYERPRLRKDAGGDDTRVGQALAIAERTGRVREDLARRAARLIVAHAEAPSPGLVRLDPAFARADDGQAALHMLRVLLAVTGGATHLPAIDSAKTLLAGLATGKARATLSRCVVDARRAGIFIHREARGLPAPCRAVDGMVWDGRRRITFGDDDGDLVIAPHGAGAAAFEREGVPQSLTKAALAAEPVLRRDLEDLSTPGAGERSRFEPVMAPWRLFLPGFDLPLARAVAALIGAPPIPVSPFSGPIGVGPWSNA